jgi:hypothetical protein
VAVNVIISYNFNEIIYFKLDRNFLQIDLLIASNNFM